MSFYSNSKALCDSSTGNLHSSFKINSGLTVASNRNPKNGSNLSSSELIFKESKAKPSVMEIGGGAGYSHITKRWSGNGFDRKREKSHT